MKESKSLKKRDEKKVEEWKVRQGAFDQLRG